MNEQLTLDLPKDKKETRVTIKLNQADLIVLKKGMASVGESNMSSYIRRLIHEKKNK